MAIVRQSKALDNDNLWPAGQDCVCPSHDSKCICEPLKGLSRMKLRLHICEIRRYRSEILDNGDQDGSNHIVSPVMFLCSTQTQYAPLFRCAVSPSVFPRAYYDTYVSTYVFQSYYTDSKTSLYTAPHHNNNI